MQSYSQLGQDLFVMTHLQKREGVFVELGAYDGVHHSNTLLLEQECGWGGFLIEGNPHLFAELEKNRIDAITVNEVIAGREGHRKFYEGGSYSGILDTMPEDFRTEHLRRRNTLTEVYTTTLGRVLQKYKAPYELDYLSLDVEGAEYEILKSLELEPYSFKVITVEFRYDMLLLEKLQELLAPRYRLAQIQDFDAFFVSTV